MLKMIDGSRLCGNTTSLFVQSNLLNSLSYFHLLENVKFYFISILRGMTIAAMT